MVGERGGGGRMRADGFFFICPGGCGFVAALFCFVLNNYMNGGTK